MNEELVKIDERIAGIPALLNNFKINEPDAGKYSTTKYVLWFVACVLLIVLASLVAVCFVVTRGLSHDGISCNNVVLICLLVLGFAAFVIFALGKVLQKCMNITNDRYNRQLDMFDCYRKLMLERRIKDEDALRKIHFNK